MNVEVCIYDPHYWIFSVGIALERYEEEDQHHKWVRKCLKIGLLIGDIRFSFFFNKTAKGV